MPVRVKSEPGDEQSPTTSAIAPVSAPSLADVASDGLPPMDVDMDELVPITSQHVDQEEEDEIVREIDVFLSPEMSKQLHLMQFPLQRQATTSQQSGPNTARRDRPQAARIKPRHCMIELDYSTTPDDSDGGSHDYNGQYYMSTRTFSSQTIPVSTHMALGKLTTVNSAGTPGLHLVPLTRITQMRPNFEHVNEATLSLMASSEEDADAMPSQSLDARRPLNFQKKESERAALARKSSYAYKKASEDNEIWIPLEIHGEKTTESSKTLSRVACTSPNQNLLLASADLSHDEKTLSISADATPSAPVSSHTAMGRSSSMEASSLSSYIQSLNYLPFSQGTTTNGARKVDTDEPSSRDSISAVVGKMVEYMHLGWPMPFSVLREQFDQSLYTDEILLQALNTCAVMVRGNFVLQSRLMPLAPAVVQARTFILFLFQSVEVVHRARLEHVYHGDNQVTPEVLMMLLEQLGTRASEGWRLKVEDDTTLPVKYPAVSQLHLDYWRNQVRRFGPLFERYRHLPQENGGT